MKTIIIGAGEIGFHLAKELSREHHDVVIIEANSERLQRVSQNLDVLTLQGDGTRQKLLVEAGIKSADMLIAVSDSDQTNILACMIAREFGVKTKIARIRDHELSGQDSILAPERIGIDLMIHPELEAARETIRLIRHPQATEVIEFFEGKVELLGLKLSETSPVVGKTLIEIGQSFAALPFRMAAIARGAQTLIPRGEQRVEEGDLIYVVTRQDAAHEVFTLAGLEVRSTHDLMVLGASRVGLLVVEGLQEDRRINVKLVDANPQKAEQVAGRMPSALVVEADGRDIDAMVAEGLTDMSTFLACTNDDETNIVTSLVARHLEVPHIITLVEKKFYLPIIRAIGLEIAVNKHILTSNAILKYIHHGVVLSVSLLRGINAETIVYYVGEKAKITKKPLENLNFPEGSLVGAIRRHGNVIIPTGKTQILPGDEVLVFYLPEARHKVDSWFE
ncbi:MAG: Trk system potassium transporter TrkA [bacterium]